MTEKHLIPLALKLAYSLFVAVLVPYYWATYSAWNFLFFCDFALILGLAALWLESPLLMSLAAVGITVPQLLWVADLLVGSRITGMTSYMFNSKLPVFVPRPFILSRLAAVRADLGRVAAGIRPPGTGWLDVDQHHHFAELFLPGSQAPGTGRKPKPGREYQLRAWPQLREAPDSDGALALDNDHDRRVPDRLLLASPPGVSCDHSPTGCRNGPS